jgi:hypothetical protein
LNQLKNNAARAAEFFSVGAKQLDFDLSAKLVVREAISSPIIGVNEGYSVVEARA